jgi:hypothetical protein
MSVVQERSDWFQGEEVHEMACIPDASCSQDDMADMSICSYFSMPPSEVDFSETNMGKVSQEEEKMSKGEEISLEDGPQSQGERQDDETQSPNWKVIGTPSIIETPPIADRDIDMSLTSNRSLANVMGIAGEDGGCNLVSHSTPRRKAGLGSSSSKTRETARKSLCSEMGFTAASPGQGSSPCRTSSDLSSLHRRQMTAETISDSFMSSGVSEEMIISPDVTPERIVEGDRDIIVVEMDESFPQDTSATTSTE